MKLKILAIATLLASNLFAGSDPFVGRWIWNLKKSQKPVITYAVKDLGNNQFSLTGSGGGNTTVIKADGKLISSPFGGTVSFKKLNDSKWSMVWNDHGKLERTYTVFADDKTLQLYDIFTQEDGDQNKTTTAYARTTDGKGILGEWKSTSVNQDVQSKSGSETDIKLFGKMV